MRCLTASERGVLLTKAILGTAPYNEQSALGLADVRALGKGDVMIFLLHF